LNGTPQRLVYVAYVNLPGKIHIREKNTKAILLASKTGLEANHEKKTRCMFTSHKENGGEISQHEDRLTKSF
jgi:hypothetical protein